MTDGDAYYVIADGSSGMSLSLTKGGPAISLTLANGATTLTGTPNIQPTGFGSIAVNQDWNVEFKAKGTVNFSAPDGTVDVGSEQTINLDQVLAAYQKMCIRDRSCWSRYCPN